MTTIEQYDEVIAGCRKTFLQKTIDYGTSWRVYRTISVADQIYIKAKRIRTIQQIQSQKIGDDIQSELQGIINYSIIGLIQLDINNDEPENLDITLLEKLYDEKVFLAAHCPMMKMAAKILRIRQIIANEGKTLVSEGIDANFLDILNYAVFALILISEEKLK